VLIRLGNRELFLEIVGFGPVANTDEVAYSRHLERLMGSEDGQYWDGDVPGFLNRADEASWQAAVADAAVRCRESQETAHVSGPWGTLSVHPDGAGNPGTLHGPQINQDLGARLRTVLDKKAAQTWDAGVAWIWVEDFGGLYPYAPFVSMQLGDKLTALSRLADSVFQQRPHVGGVIWTRAVRTESSIERDAVDESGAAVHRRLPGGVVRETVAAHRRVLLPDQFRIIASLTNAEVDWLDWALSELRSEPLRKLLS
jgi:hypothetical protein